MGEVLRIDERDGERVAGTCCAANLPIGYFAAVAGRSTVGATGGIIYHAAGTIASLAGSVAVDGVGVDAIGWCGLRWSWVSERKI